MIAVPDVGLVDSGNRRWYAAWLLRAATCAIAEFGRLKFGN